jgi:hypothetical protein
MESMAQKLQWIWICVWVTVHASKFARSTFSSGMDPVWKEKHFLHESVIAHTVLDVRLCAPNLR